MATSPFIDPRSMCHVSLRRRPQRRSGQQRWQCEDVKREPKKLCRDLELLLNFARLFPETGSRPSGAIARFHLDDQAFEDDRELRQVRAAGKVSALFRPGA